MLIVRWLIVFSMLCSTALYAAENDLQDLRRDDGNPNEWRLVFNNKTQKIKTYFKKEDKKRVRSFRMEAELDAPLSTVANVEFDADNYKNWYYQVEESKLLKIVSDTEFYTYIRYNSPGGLPDRDTVFQTVIKPYSKKTGYMMMLIKNKDDYIMPSNGITRIAVLDMVAKFTPIGTQKTLMEIEGYMDPGGFAPMWAVNLVQRTTPLTTIIGLQRMLLLPRYSSPTYNNPFKYTE
ncbi:START domain-containing protein [Agitococcus lubricus]|uniref:START domain-containing protein n=1 Tax=Agitococcus lubricus TaxID=1077255 RepID=A0A2T5J1U9_9GAMM|nr:START domain-containing protein [Agitococcus lubricus]PTQ90420.1 hypothetical protein C8N29_103173 [Agitococcus lubricus]